MRREATNPPGPAWYGFPYPAHPLAARRIGLARYEVLAEKIRETLEAAIRAGGSTLRDFVGGFGHPLHRQRGAPGDSRAAHEAVQDRLASNRAVAERNGWTSFSLERSGGMGPLRLWGVPPSREDRDIVPDALPRQD